MQINSMPNGTLGDKFVWVATGKAVVCSSWNLTGRLSSPEGASVSPEVQFCYFNGNVPCFIFGGPCLLLLRFGHKPLKTRDDTIIAIQRKTRENPQPNHKPDFKNYTPALINIGGLLSVHLLSAALSILQSLIKSIFAAWPTSRPLIHTIQWPPYPTSHQSTGEEICWLRHCFW